MKFGSKFKNGFMFIFKLGIVMDIVKLGIVIDYISGLSIEIIDGMNGENIIEEDVLIGIIIVYVEGIWD